MSAPNYPCNSNDSRNEDGSVQPCMTTEPSSVFFSCKGNNGARLDQIGGEQVVLEYDYEIHTPLVNYDAVPNAINIFQNGLAEDLAKEYNIRECGRRKRRQLGATYSSDESKRNLGTVAYLESHMMGVSSNPSDFRDQKIVKCVMPSNINIETTCTPVKGHLTIWREPGQRRLSNEDVLRIIESYFDTNKYKNDQVLDVAYIGKRGLVPVGIMNPDILARKPGNRQLVIQQQPADKSLVAGMKTFPEPQRDSKQSPMKTSPPELTSHSKASQSTLVSAIVVLALFAVLAAVRTVKKGRNKKMSQASRSDIELPIQVI